MAEDRGWVYVVWQKGAGFYKIGYTSMNPLTRLKSLQTGNPNRLQVLCRFRGNRAKERRYHKLFQKHHHYHEWFSCSRATFWSALIRGGPRKTKIKRIDGRWRLLDDRGAIVKTKLGDPIDGGGYLGREPLTAASRAINLAARKNGG